MSLIERESLEEMAYSLQENLSDAAGKKMGFVLIIFEHGHSPTAQYISTTNNHSALLVLRKFMEKLGEEYGGIEN